MKRLLCIALMLMSMFGLYGCGNDEKAENETVFCPTVNECGTWFSIPQNILKDYFSSLEIQDPDGNALQVLNGCFLTDKVGKYTLKCDENVAFTIDCVDTEKPSFKCLFDTIDYNYIQKYYVFVGDTVELGKIFIAVDNSGVVETSFNVLEGGCDEITLNGDMFNVESNVDYYLVYATAKDNYGNMVILRQKLYVI